MFEAHEGEVEDIRVRATLLRTYDTRRVVISNSEVYTNRVTVNTAYTKRRLSVEVGIGYGDDIAAARAIGFAPRCNIFRISCESPNRPSS